MPIDATAVNIITILFSFLIGGVAGAAAMFLFRRTMISRQMRAAEKTASRLKVEAESSAREVLRDAKAEAEKFKSRNDKEYRERRSEVHQRETRLAQKEATLEHKLDGASQRERALVDKEKEMESIRSQLKESRDKQLKQMELISGLSTAEAQAQLLDAMQIEMRDETSRRLKDWEAKLKEEADQKAQEILSQAI